MTSHCCRSIQAIRFLLCITTASLLLACGGGDSSSGTTLPTNAITYTTINNPVATSPSYFTSLTGIRGVANSSDVYITGSTILGTTYTAQLYKGPLTGGGTYYTMSYPSSSGVTAASTNSYSVDNLPNGEVHVVGSYINTQISATQQQGYIYTGPVINNPTSGFETINFPGALVTIPHSVMNDLVVGGYQSQAGALHAFIYQISTRQFTQLTVTADRNIAQTAYGIWHNGGSSYTIAGGYTDVSGVQQAYILDYDSSNGAIANTAAYTFNNQPATKTHFEGITTNGSGGYYLAGSGEMASGVILSALVNITRTSNGFTSAPAWVTVAFPGATTQDSNTVYQNNLLGTYSPGPLSLNGYVANVPASLIK